MYVKLFKSIYTGSLCGKNHCLSVFIHLLAHADSDGCVDIHPKKIAFDTGLTIEETKKALIELEEPDDESRTEVSQGRRLERMNDHRDWGWHIINYQKYRDIRNEDDRKRQNREAQARRRSKKQPKNENSQPCHADCQHESADVSNVSLGIYPSASASQERGVGKTNVASEMAQEFWFKIPGMTKSSVPEFFEHFKAKLDWLDANGRDETETIWKGIRDPQRDRGAMNNVNKLFLFWKHCGLEDKPGKRRSDTELKSGDDRYEESFRQYEDDMVRLHGREEADRLIYLEHKRHLREDA